MFEFQFTGPDRTMFTGEFKKKKKRRQIREGPQGWFGALAALLGSFLGQDLHKVEEPLADLSDLDQHVKSVCKVRE